MTARTTTSNGWQLQHHHSPTEGGDWCGACQADAGNGPELAPGTQVRSPGYVGADAGIGIVEGWSWNHGWWYTVSFKALDGRSQLLDASRMQVVPQAAKETETMTTQTRTLAEKYAANEEKWEKAERRSEAAKKAAATRAAKKATQTTKETETMTTATKTSKTEQLKAQRVQAAKNREVGSPPIRKTAKQKVADRLAAEQAAKTEAAPVVLRKALYAEDADGTRHLAQRGADTALAAVCTQRITLVAGTEQVVTWKAVATAKTSCPACRGARMATLKGQKLPLWTVQRNGTQGTGKAALLTQQSS